MNSDSKFLSVFCLGNSAATIKQITFLFEFFVPQMDEFGH
jgi:hypothetical protein